MKKENNIPHLIKNCGNCYYSYTEGMDKTAKAICEVDKENLKEINLKEMDKSVCDKWESQNKDYWCFTIIRCCKHGVAEAVVTE